MLASPFPFKSLHFKYVVLLFTSTQRNCFNFCFHLQKFADFFFFLLPKKLQTNFVKSNFSRNQFYKMVLAFLNQISQPGKLFSTVLVARTNIFRLSSIRSASTSGIRIPGVSKSTRAIAHCNSCTVKSLKIVSIM